MPAGQPLVQAIISDLLTGNEDPMQLHKKYGLSRKRFHALVTSPEFTQEVHDACKVADLQTQAMLARYRYLAAARLHRFANEQDKDNPLPPDLARKACVDLLKINMPIGASAGATGEPRDLSEKETETRHKAMYRDMPKRDADPADTTSATNA